MCEVKEVLGLIVPLLRPGELQIIITMNEASREIGTVEKSVIELDKLARICRFEYVVSPEQRYSINKTVDLLEMPNSVWMQ